jgi:hypothetical protein
MMVLSIMMIFLLERILPSSRTVRGIENSAQASYSARWLTEVALTRLRADNPAWVLDSATLTQTTIGSAGNQSRVIDSDTIIPSPGYGNSEWDSQWNAIGPGRPVQLIIGDTTHLSRLKIEFRVPRFWSTESISGSNSDTTMFNSANDILIGYLVTNGVKNLSMAACPSSTVRGFIWSDVNRTDMPVFWNFCIQEAWATTGAQTLTSYLSTNPNFCAGTCTLKLSALRAFKKANNETIPYIEYRIRWVGVLSGARIDDCFLKYGTPGKNDADCGTGFRLEFAVPLQSSTIISTAQAWSFKKTDSRRLDQVSTAEGLDFTVFQ